MAKKKGRKKSARKATKASAKPARRPVRKPAPKTGRSRRKVSPRRAGAHRRLRAAAPPAASRDRAVTSLRFAHTMLVDMIKDFPLDKVTFQASPTDNHVLWTIGHLAATYAWFATALGVSAPALPPEFNTLFGSGTKPVPDANAYPPFAEVRKAFDASFDAMLAGALSLPDAMLTAPCAVDTGGFCRDRLDALEKAAWHEGWHSGQVSGIRRALGIKPLMG
ncbi:MAG: DinB family protein [Phycisphaeraceae bacterium]|nr:DinB family protein [Phycisphaeraceae bacterium]